MLIKEHVTARTSIFVNYYANFDLAAGHENTPMLCAFISSTFRRHAFLVCAQAFHSSVATVSSSLRAEAGSSAFEGKSSTCFLSEVRISSTRLVAGSSPNIRTCNAAAVAVKKNDIHQQGIQMGKYVMIKASAHTCQCSHFSLQHPKLRRSHGESI